MLLVMILTSCSFVPSNNQNATVTKTKIQKSKDALTKLGNFDIKLKETRDSKDTGGKDAIIIYYDFTNNSESDVMFMISVSDMAFQLDTKLVEANVTEGGPINMDLIVTKGSTITVKRAYILKDNKSDVKIQVVKNPNDDNTTIENIIKLK